MPFCIICGHQIDQGAEFCTSCGASQTQAPVLTARDHINNGDSLFTEADETRSEVKYQEALVEYDRAIQMDPTEPYAHLRKGETLERLQYFQEKPETQTRYEHSAQDEFRLASKLYQGVLAREPNNAELHFNASMAFASLGDKKAALRELDQAVRLDNSKAIYHIARAVTLYYLNRMKESLLEVDIALNLEPTNAKFAVFRIKTLVGLGRSDEASRALIEFLRVVDPEELLAAIEDELMKQDLEKNIRKVLEPFYFREALKMARAVKPSELLR